MSSNFPLFTEYKSKHNPFCLLSPELHMIIKYTYSKIEGLKEEPGKQSDLNTPSVKKKSLPHSFSLTFLYIVGQCPVEAGEGKVVEGVVEDGRG